MTTPGNSRRRLAWLWLLALAVTIGLPARAAPVEGRIFNVDGDTVQFYLPPPLTARPGAVVRIGEDLLGVGRVMLRGQWRVDSVAEQAVTATSTGAVPVPPRAGQMAIIEPAAGQPTVQAAAPSKAVADVQRALLLRGYDAGPVDNQLGAKTRSAIRAYQRDHGLAVDGQLSDELQRSLLGNSQRPSWSVSAAGGDDGLPLVDLRRVQRDTLPAVAKRAWIGVSVTDASETGAQVVNVAPGGPADQAGLRGGDRLLTVDDQPLNNATELRKIVGRPADGRPLRLGLARAGQSLTLNVVPEPAPLESRALQADLCSAYLDNESALFSRERALPWCHAAARQGDTRAQTLLGWLLETDPQGAWYNPALAYQWLQRAARQGDEYASRHLPALEPSAASWLYEKGEYEQAIVLARNLANRGDRVGQSVLGHAYEYGNAVAQDYASAEKWYRKAAAQEEYNALNGLGRLYYNGYGVPVDYGEAARWFHRAIAVQPDNAASATFNLALLYAQGHGVETDLKQAYELFNQSASQGNNDALALAAVMQIRGEGTPVDPVSGCRRLLRATEQGAGDAWAYHNRAVCHARGNGTEKNPAEAARWFHKAAEAGSVEAMAALGECYRDGLGVARDPAASMRWYRQAAQLGNAEAQFGLGNAYAHGIGVQASLATAAEWWQRAAQQGVIGAMYNVGISYAEGRGVQQSHAEAARWFHMAAERGDANSQDWLGRLYWHGNGVPQDRAKATQWFSKAAEQGHQNAAATLSDINRRRQ
jgi:TPR repeat protein